MSIGNNEKLINEIEKIKFNEFDLLSTDKDLLKNIEELESLRKERNEKIHEQLKMIHDLYDEKIDKCEKSIIAKIKMKVMNNE